MNRSDEFYVRYHVHNKGTFYIGLDQTATQLKELARRMDKETALSERARVLNDPSIKISEAMVCKDWGIG